MKKQIIIAALLIGLVFTSCTDAQWSKVGGLGDPFRVQMINCDGSVAREWISTGKVLSEANSDGYYFQDEATGKLIEVTGRLVITKL